MIDSVYTMRAEMKTVDLYKVSYYVQTALDSLSEHFFCVHQAQIFVIYHSCYYVITLMIKNLHKDNQDSRQMMLQSI